LEQTKEYNMKQVAQNPIYDNCKMYSADKVHLANCSTKRMKWYIKRGLAVSISPNEFVLQFDPNGAGNSQDVPYMLEKRENRCVVCGATEGLTRHHVVPRCYRTYFPEEYKDRNDFDILCVCIVCHEEYEKKAYGLHKLLFDSYCDIKVVVNEVKQEKENVRKAARALLRHNETIPEDHRENLLVTLSDYFGKPVTLSNLEELAKEEGLLGTRQIQSKNYVGKSYRELMEGFLKEHTLFEFIVMWRKHFLEKTNPKFLSSNWLENYNKRLK
jgi:hypothetical protein